MTYEKSSWQDAEERVRDLARRLAKMPGRKSCTEAENWLYAEQDLIARGDKSVRLLRGIRRAFLAALNIEGSKVTPTTTIPSTHAKALSIFARIIAEEISIDAFFAVQPGTADELFYSLMVFV